VQQILSALPPLEAGPSHLPNASNAIQHGGQDLPTTDNALQYGTPALPNASNAIQNGGQDLPIIGNALQYGTLDPLGTGDTLQYGAPHMPIAGNALQYGVPHLPIAGNALQHGVPNPLTAGNALQYSVPNLSVAGNAVHSGLFNVAHNPHSWPPMLQTAHDVQNQGPALYVDQGQNLAPPSPFQDANSLSIPGWDDQFAWSGSFTGFPESSRSSHPIPQAQSQDVNQSFDESGGVGLSPWSAGVGDQPNRHFPPAPPIDVSTTGNADGVASELTCAGVLSTGTLAITKRLSVYQAKWREEHRMPRNDEIQNFANLEGVDAAVIEELLLTSVPSRPAQAVSTSQASHDVSHMASQFSSQAVIQSTPHSRSPGVSQIILDVRRYAIRRNKGQCGHSKQAKRGRRNQLYKCPDCMFSSDKWDSFKRHLLTKYPQEFYHCIRCRQEELGSFIVSRADKIGEHLEKFHKLVGEEAKNLARQESKVDYVAPSPTSCPYRVGGRRCMESLSTWEEYITHLKKHGQKQVPGGLWDLPGRHDSSDQDPNGNSRGNSSGSNRYLQGPYEDSGENQHAGHNGHSASCSGPSQYVNDYPGGANYQLNHARKLREFCMHAQLGIKLPRDKICAPSPRGPSSLIDIFNRRIVQVPADAKYLALDYTMALNRCAHLKSFIEMMRRSHTCQSLPEDVKDLVAQAITVTQDMGYQYVWIDLLCDLNLEEKRRPAVYADATFVIFTRGHRPEVDSMNLLLCNNRYLHTVRSWTNDTKNAVLFSHVQDLGRGSFGLVDKVELTSDGVVQSKVTEREFARKRFLRWKVGDPGRPAHLQEIESLQKFEHPNIASVVAAYIEKQALNVVMLPVAETDLKRYLKEPSRWPEKHASISKWYCSLASAIEYMHKTCLYRHGDLKPENILMVKDDVCITDLGFAQPTCATGTGVLEGGKKSKHTTGTSGCTMMTPKYCPPGTLAGRSPTLKSDIFSLGCVFLEIITIEFGRTLHELSKFILKQPSPDADNYVMYCKHINSMRRWLVTFMVPNLSALQWTVIKLCYRMLDPNPKVRPSAIEIHTSLKDSQRRSSRAPTHAPNLKAQPSGTSEPSELHETIEAVEPREPIEPIEPIETLPPIMPSMLSAWLRNTLQSIPNNFDGNELLPLSKCDIDIDELMLAKVFASVIARVSKVPEQLDGLKMIACSLPNPRLFLEDALVALPEPLHLFLCGYASASTTASQLHLSSEVNARKKWGHALGRLKYMIRTTKTLHSLKGTIKPTITTNAIVDLDEQQISQSLEALVLKPRRMSMALTRPTRGSWPPFQAAQTCQKGTMFERRKRAMSKTRSENPAAKKKFIFNAPVHRQDLALFTQTVVTFERGDPILTNLSYHNGSQYLN
jgi:serine/threonine protein kinase